MLLAANSMQIPLEGEYRVCFQISGKEFAKYTVVTQAVNKFILGIDFLAENGCR